MNKSNILATLTDLETGLKEVDSAKQQLEASISILRQLLDNKWLDGGKAASMVSTPVQRSTRTIPSPLAASSEIEIVPSDRVQTALIGIHGRFVRSELFNNACNDGLGPIGLGTFGNIFSKLIKRKQIFCVEGKPGQRNAVYVKADEYEKFKSESPENLGFNLLGDK